MTCEECGKETHRLISTGKGLKCQDCHEGKDTRLPSSYRNSDTANK